MSSPGASFRPPWWATLGTLALGGLCVTAGVWQLNRAEEKAALIAAFDAGAAADAIPAPLPGTDVTVLRYQAITASGRYDAAHQVLLDARTRDGKAGYEVLTPLIRENLAILVNRGWVAANPDRTRLPDITVGGEQRTVVGRLDQLPRAALRTGQGDATGWPRRMLFPTIAEISAALGYPAGGYQLLLDAAQPDGLRRDWWPTDMTPTQHRGYALQWFALAAGIVVIYVVSNRPKAAPGPRDPSLP